MARRGYDFAHRIVSLMSASVRSAELGRPSLRSFLHSLLMVYLRWKDTISVVTSPHDPLQKRTRPRRLINTRTIKLEEFSSNDSVPPYAILSHCWEAGHEISYQEMVKCQLLTAASIRSKSGYRKIVAACMQARKDNFTYIWIDTCCIDKGDHGQLSQDINSMFDYYKNSEVCYVYLYDYYPWFSRGWTLQNLVAPWNLGGCSWFFRGWTLQELVAPSSVKFFDAKWKYCGDRKTLNIAIWAITGIRWGLLEGGKQSKMSVL
ncbi:hypothetical protein D9758_017441 [Tetrapyrgos nigripes]|uniref:Heterokaryon incompatibility domain-containing protein n=1 Tax=Tetrapyrgos nigripes TaxID=182062 RepID=A0A8H5FFN5_9AGAR|nr:hypothetical protein D9758_017441 [Tetrapyrgos nigripes]